MIRYFVMSAMLAGFFIPANAQSFSKELEDAAKSGDVKAQRDLGICYYKGEGVKQNDKKAYEWLEKAGSDCTAQYYMAKMFEEERVKMGATRIKGEIGFNMALQLYNSAASCGSVEAQMKLYYYYKEKRQMINAMSWLSQASNSGNAEAMYLYALQTEDNDEKVSLLQEAVNKGYAPAQSELVKAKLLVEQEKKKIQPYRKIEVKQPSSVLSVLPLEIMPKLDSLTIIGILDENDIKALENCTSLKYLNLKETYTTLSQAEQRKRNAEQQFLQGMFQAMGELSEAKYRNGEISTTDNLQVQLFTELAKGSNNVKKASVGCVIPLKAFCGLQNLETVILPSRASEIESKAFMECPKLKNVVLPPFLSIIGRGAFSFCPNLQTIQFPASLTSIGGYDQQHTYGTSGAASFVNSGIEVFDFSNCSFKYNSRIDNSWTYRFVGCNALKKIWLPQGIETIDVGFSSSNEVVCYVPASVKRLTLKDASEVHFASPEPPRLTDRIYNCTIYVPKGCMTAYYAAMGDRNTLKEE